MSAQGDCEFLVKRARELVPGDLWAAKAWLITARSLYPADFNIQVNAAAPAQCKGAPWAAVVPQVPSLSLWCPVVKNKVASL
uniref:Integrator complex subunit 10 n=1 Tax=Accipiter nisus TaxID=211598 RepID=A0A8B9RVV7_9AVES